MAMKNAYGQTIGTGALNGSFSAPAPSGSAAPVIAPATGIGVYQPTTAAGKAAKAGSVGFQPTVAPAIITPSNQLTVNPFVQKSQQIELPKPPTSIQSSLKTAELPAQLATNKTIVQQQQEAAALPIKQRVDKIYTDNPNLVANKDFISAVAKAYNIIEPAKLASLQKMAGTARLQDVMTAVGAQKVYSDSNDANEDSKKMPEPKYQDKYGRIDTQKVFNDIETQIKNIESLIQSERDAYDTGTRELGNQLGRTSVVNYGEQQYNEQRKEAVLNRMLAEKSNILAAGSRTMAYAESLRKDQQDGWATAIKLGLENGVVDEKMIKTWAEDMGINPDGAYNMYVMAAANRKNLIEKELNKGATPDMQITGQVYDENTGQYKNVYQYYDTATKTWKSSNGTTTSNPNQDNVPSGGLFETGAYGGQCGDYVHKIVDGVPAMGDLYTDKMKIANISTKDWQVGDMLIQRTKMPYGHVSVVTGINQDGSVTVNESNWNNDEKVGTRIIKKTDPTVTGVYRGGIIKQQAPKETFTDQIASDIFTGTRPYSEIDKLPKTQQQRVRNSVNTMKEKSLTEYERTGNAAFKFAATVGGKQLTQSVNDDIAKKMTVVAELQDLKTDIDKLNTGAFKGRILEKEFWNGDAATVRARIQGLIPTVARGVFSEVGVLTDTDIENYKKTIPDMKTPKDAVNTIYENLLTTIERQITNKLNTYANSRYDVSGHAEDYDNLMETITKIKDTGISDEDAQGIIESIMSSGIPGTVSSLDQYNQNLSSLNIPNRFQ